MILNIKHEIVRRSEEKMGEKLCDLELKKEILDMTPKAWLQQNDQISSNFKTCSVKDTVKRLQRNRLRENIYKSHRRKNLYFKYKKKILKLNNNKKAKNPI